jgi:hypothetical protein
LRIDAVAFSAECAGVVGDGGCADIGGRMLFG